MMPRATASQRCPYAFLSSNFQHQSIIKRPIVDHHEQCRESSMGQRDRSLVLAFSSCPFPVTVFTVGPVNREPAELLSA